MSSDGLSDWGEEWAWTTCFRQDAISSRDAELEVLLYNDGTDALTDASDVSEITTEPSDGNYSRQSLALDSPDLTLGVSDGNIRVKGLVSFDLTDTTGTVDAWAVVVNFKSNLVGSESEQNPHLLTSAALDDESMDLSNYESRDVGVNIELD